MELGSIGSRADALPQAVSLRENEAAERVPDKEASEAPRQEAASKSEAPRQEAAPLPSYAGNIIDTQA